MGSAGWSCTRSSRPRRRVAAIAGRRAKVELLAELPGALLPPGSKQRSACCRERRARAGSASAMLLCARREVRLRRPRRRSRSPRSMPRWIGSVEVRGKGAGAERARLLHELFARATADEQDFLVRLLLGELRQGALEGLMIEAIARASGLPADEVRRAVMMAGDIGTVAKAALGEGRTGAGPVRRPAVPADQADAGPARRRRRRCARHARARGLRVQARWRAHPGAQGRRRGARVQPPAQRGDRGGAGDRRGGAGPARARGDPGRRGDRAARRTAGRSRSRSPCGASAASSTSPRCAQSLPLQSFFFDVLALDGVPLDRSARQSERFAALARRCAGAPAHPAHRDRSSGRGRGVRRPGARRRATRASWPRRCDAPYEAGARGKSWLKVKTATTLDLVVLAAEWGNGRRQGWLSNLHLGARDPAHGGFVMLGKTFKGMTDQMLAWQTEQLLAREIGARRLHRLRPPRAGGRDRVQRPAGEPALSRAAWRCASPGSRPTAPTSGRRRPTPSTRCARSTSARPAALAGDTA